MGASTRTHSPGEGEGVLLGILGGGVPPRSQSPDPISDPKMSFSTPVFRPDLYNPYSFSDLEEVTKRNMHVYKDRNYIIITEIRAPTKDFLIIHFEFTLYGFISHSFGTNRQIC